MLPAAIVTGFVATALAAIVPMHEAKAAPLAAAMGVAYKPDVLWKEEPQVAFTLVAAGLVAAVLSAVLLFGNGVSGSVSPGAKMAIAVMALIVLVLHLVAAFMPGMLMSTSSCAGNKTYEKGPNELERGVARNQIGKWGYAWLLVGLVVCGGIAYVALMKLED